MVTRASNYTKSARLSQTLLTNSAGRLRCQSGSTEVCASEIAVSAVLIIKLAALMVRAEALFVVAEWYEIHLLVLGSSCAVQ